MNSITPAASLTTYIAEAVRRIAPLWPLDHFVAVNPFVGLVNRPFDEACQLLERTTGSAPLLDATQYVALYDAGKITDADLAAVAPAGMSPSTLHEKLLAPRSPAPRLRLWSGHLDHSVGRAKWAPFFVEEVAKMCATYFDENQTTWCSPWRRAGLFTGWRELAAIDRTAEIFGLRGFRRYVAALPPAPESAIADALRRLGCPASLQTDFLHTALSTIQGWAGYTRYLAHQDELHGRPNSATVELLAIRLTYEAALVASGQFPDSVLAQWHRDLAHHAELCPRSAGSELNAGETDVDVRPIWQLAYERHFQNELVERIAVAPLSPSPLRPNAQAVFCIDVRSEPFRRQLETAGEGIQTLGFAGFFGFPLAHRAAGDTAASARCPVLLAPRFDTRENSDANPTERDRRLVGGAAKAFQNAAASTFSFVESAGFGFVPALWRDAIPRPRPQCRSPRPELDLSSPESLDALAQTAAGSLRAMSLTEGFARLILLCGHGSRSSNNPHASSLACGACGGYAGDANARIAARVFNHPAIRARLTAQGIAIPADTVFVAGLHDTMTDEVTLFETSDVPDSHALDVQALARALRSAGAATRRERAPGLGLSNTADPLAALHTRAADAAQVRPEWGLANNAALIVGPRHCTAGLTLSGRAFLHDYDSARDADGRILELILSAPVVVASWINLQYYASSVDPQRYGAGSKILHNVVGGFGVFEGNGGDLRAGLPWQSVSDGEQLRHEPRRLTVFIAASRAKLSRALDRLPKVRALFVNDWIHLVAMEDDRFHLYRRGHWEKLGARLDTPIPAAA